MKWFSMDIPVGWGAAVARSVIVAIVTFAVLQIKEFIDAGAFDTPATGTDALLIAVVFLAVNAICMFLAPRRAQQRLAR